ncbi:DUF1223 domain-containing protein [Paracoccus aestuariivivens]|uniref:DUF1223 domain-containing protein n=1 Tax=Paracoccus aestuariivivens TaxID=1820333 RepID=A0A6L6J915_9RHOB|nr:DUF1223 domain-containing protein [Paracoccus aestuariivivens]MTH78582.1 DUF1223 domain-containing protein [Paracoccus aestuariivivens]
MHGLHSKRAADTRRQLAVLVVAAVALLGQPVLAQEGAGTGSSHGGFSGGGHASVGGFTQTTEPVDDAVGTMTLDAPTGSTLSDGGRQAGAEDGIGLIEAPEAGTGIDGSLLSGVATGTIDETTGVSSFAERRTAQARARMAGPIGHPPVVVELFTSQGCSSCPPADEMLNDLADRDDILALSWHVDYWDYLGWADDFARPEFTRRQQSYARAWGERGIYTPQMVVAGSDTLIAVRPADLMALVENQMARPAPVLVTSREQDDGYQLELTPREPIPNGVAILLVRYAPQKQVVIRAGENRGMQVTYRNVVLAAERIGEWDGRAPLRMTVRAQAEPGSAFPPDTRHAILAQMTGRDRERRATGPILAAIKLD